MRTRDDFRAPLVTVLGHTNHKNQHIKTATVNGVDVTPVFNGLFSIELPLDPNAVFFVPDAERTL